MNLSDSLSLDIDTIDDGFKRRRTFYIYTSIYLNAFRSRDSNSLITGCLLRSMLKVNTWATDPAYRSTGTSLPILHTSTHAFVIRRKLPART